MNIPSRRRRNNPPHRWWARVSSCCPVQLENSLAGKLARLWYCRLFCRLLVDVLFRVEPLRECLERLFLWRRSAGDGSGNFLAGVREVSFSGVHSCQPNVHDPIVRILLGVFLENLVSLFSLACGL